MRISWLAVAAATLAFCGTAHATTLLDLTDGTTPTLTIGGLTFSNFTAVSTGPAAVPLSAISVIPVFQGGGYGFELADSLTASGTSYGDLAVTYTVSGAKINDAFLNSAGSAQNGSSWNIGENLTSGVTEVGQLTATNTSPSDHIYFGAVSSLDVTKDVGWAGNGGTPGVDLSIVAQTFSTVPGPVPGTGLAGLAALALAGLYTRARRA